MSFPILAGWDLGPRNTRETLVKEYMIDDSGKASFDKERGVKGTYESKITGSDLQVLENSCLGLLSQVYTLWQDKPKLRVVYWFSSQKLRVALTVTKLHF